MDQNKIQSFVMANAGKFDPAQLASVTERMKELPDDRFVHLAGMELQSPTTMLIISIFAGGFGVDRFMLGQTGLGVAKLLTCGGMGIWSVIDWFLVMGLTRKANYEKFMLASA